MLTPREHEVLSDAEKSLYDLKEGMKSDLNELAFLVAEAHQGLSDALSAGIPPSAEILMVRDGILDQMASIRRQREELDVVLRAATQDRVRQQRDAGIRSMLLHNAAMQQAAQEHKREMREARKARKKIVEDALSRNASQCQATDEELSVLAERASRLFAMPSLGGVGSNWGMRIRPGKAPGS